MSAPSAAELAALLILVAGIAMRHSMLGRLRGVARRKHIRGAASIRTLQARLNRLAAAAARGAGLFLLLAQLTKT